MSRPRLAGVLIGLVLGFGFYLAHRSDRTLSNQLVAWLAGPTAYARLKSEVRDLLPVHVALRGCLPSILWCFVVTALISGWHIRLGSRCALRLAWWGPLFNAGLEFAQGVHWTDGHADGLDVVAGFAGGILALAMFPCSRRPFDIPCSWNWRLGLVAAGFACVGLADVWP